VSSYTAPERSLPSLAIARVSYRGMYACPGISPTPYKIWNRCKLVNACFMWASKQGSRDYHKLLYYWFRSLADLGEGRALNVSTVEKVFKQF